MKWRTVQTVDAPDLKAAKAALKLARKPIMDALDAWRGQQERVESEWENPERKEKTPGPVSLYRSKVERDGTVSIQFCEVDR